MRKNFTFLVYIKIGNLASLKKNLDGNGGCADRDGLEVGGGVAGFALDKSQYAC